MASMVFAASAAEFTPEKGIPAGSKHGLRLMQSATPVDSEGRALEQNRDNGEWMYNYSLKYLGCSSLFQISGERGGNDEDSVLYKENLIRFGLCLPDESCSACSGKSAQYVVGMEEFLMSYLEMKQEEQEQACETAQDYTCAYCENQNNNDDQSCINQCYVDNKMDYCIEVEGQEEVDMDRFMECAEVEAQNNNNNNNNYNYNYNQNNNNNVNPYAQYFVGAYCNMDDGHSINIGVFQDAGCISPAPSNTYEALTYGQTLPFENESIISSDCIACKRVDQDQNQNQNDNNNNYNYNYNNNNGNNNNNNNQDQNYEVNEICQQSYEQAARCESGLDNVGGYFYPDTSGCEYINNILPKLERASRQISSRSIGGAGDGKGVAIGFAVLFAMSTIVLGAYSFFLYRKISRAKTGLAASDGVSA
eukprot:CAMPEP_0198112830 /NCGR_PEP_ID=MMETSP1442-20131203/4618_1 /TAXON_ID= /ORGANISM="Craspedostauros australis, Strain CCMP3328" /LENGTH=419 /DNA_ID=CAMNT_0043769745 /DNA_START=32 /DNA_END=1291 /DNA_ORIENTATION=-